MRARGAGVKGPQSAAIRNSQRDVKCSTGSAARDPVNTYVGCQAGTRFIGVTT